MIIIQYEQCVAARGLLKWKPRDLAEKSGVGYLAISEFERGKRNLRIDNLVKIIKTFEEAGIKFKNNDNGIGVELIEKNNADSNESD